MLIRLLFLAIAGLAARRIMEENRAKPVALLPKTGANSSAKKRGTRRR